MKMGDQATNNNIKHKKRYYKCNIHKQIGREITSRVVGYQVSNKGGLASHRHGSFTIAKEKYLVKEEKIRKGMEGRNS